MNSLSHISNAEQTYVWPDDDAIAAARKTPCLTELSALGLIGGAILFSTVLWTAIFAVI